MILDSTRQLYKDYFEKFGLRKEEVVSPSLTYRGWAPLNALDSEARWLIERESMQSGVKVNEYADNGDFDQIWANRSTAFSALSWSNDYSLYMDGVNDYVDLGDNFNKERTESWSWSFWFKPRIVTTQQYIVHRRNSSGVGWDIRMLSTGKINFNLCNTLNTNHLQVSSVGNLNSGVWHHVVVTYSGGSLPASVTMYINGTSQSISTVTNNLTSSTLVSGISAQMGQWTNISFLDGYLDEVSHWNTVLDQAKVTALYNNGTPANLADHVSYANLVNWWRNGDGDSYPTLNDNRGTVDGTMVNSVSSSLAAVAP